MRELTLEELELISGGSNTTVVDEIVVVGDGGGDDWGDWGDWGDDWYDGGDYGDGGGGDSGDQPPDPPQCADGEASDRAAEINAAPADGLERGSVIYRDASGNLVSTPVVAGTPGNVSVSLPAGVGLDDVVGFVHSHPPQPTGDPALDAMYDAADRYPSPGDWDQMDAAVAGGADPATLSFYVIDTTGALREYNYSDKATYDVPEGQLLGQAGYPPPPPVPPAMAPGSGCGG